MYVIKVFGSVLLIFTAFICVGASAQQVPVSCTWAVISSYGPPDNSWRDIVRHCKEPDGTLVATQSFRGFSGGGVLNCSLAPVSNVGYTGDCMSPSFYRTHGSSSSVQSSSAASSVSACTTPGVRVHGGCNGAYNSNLLTQPNILARCGVGCSLEHRVIGWTSACPNEGTGRSPEFGLYCK